MGNEGHRLFYSLHVGKLARKENARRLGRFYSELKDRLVTKEPEDKLCSKRCRDGLQMVMDAKLALEERGSEKGG